MSLDPAQRAPHGYKNGAWQSIGAELTAYGVWDTGSSSCDLEQRVVINVPGFTKVRIAAKVHYVDGSGEHAAKVSTKVVHTAFLLE